MTRAPLLLAAGLALPLLSACERPIGLETEQLGPRGVGMEQVTNPRVQRAQRPIPDPVLLAATPGEPLAREVYQNVQVLGDLPVSQFNALMSNITNWVSPVRAGDPNSGCNYCHNPENMASEEKYTFTVSRSMINMTRTINQDWQTHVKDTGVTCWTCHRGQPVPGNVWVEPAPERSRGLLQTLGGQNMPMPSVAYATLPFDPFSRYFAGSDDIRVVSNEIHRSPNHVRSIQATEATYGLMMHMSDALGVNCTYCHNSRNFGSWNTSREQRVGSWYAIRMTRETNNQYITPLALKGVIPARGFDGQPRLGPTGGALKTNCATCHQGQAKPMGGVSMLDQAPSLAAHPAGYGSTRAQLLAGRVGEAVNEARARIEARRAAESAPAEEAAPGAPVAQAAGADTAG
ncbi:MAG: photosynthetic reaction center cytochrome PufC [Thermaurantiacus sp.]